MFVDYLQWVWVFAAGVLHVVCFVGVVVHCLQVRKDAGTTIAWLFLVWGVPVLGPALYLAFGVNRVVELGWRKQHSDESFMSERRAREDESLPLSYWRTLRESLAGEPADRSVREMNHMLDGLLGDWPLLGGNVVEPLITGDEAYPRMLAAIDGAKHHIHLQAFIIGNDEVGREFLARIRRKAEEGVRCRVLYDRLGSARAMMSGLFRRHRHVAGMKLVGWTQANPIRRQFQLNLRNHRKMLIVDGKEAFTGGLNLHVENTRRGDTPPIRDYHFRVAGPVAQELQYAFLRDWYFMTREDPDVLLSADHFPHVDPAGSALARVVVGGPTAEVEALTDVTCAVLQRAQKQLLVVTPYFVPPPDILRGLRLAALRGVQVRLVVPRRTNHIYAGFAGQALYQELLRSGVEIFERAPPFMHSKAMVVDGHLSIVGTANLDNRSLRLNYETNLVVFDEVFANRVKRAVLDDMSASESIDLDAWRQRSSARRLAENLCSLLTPIL